MQNTTHASDDESAGFSLNMRFALDFLTWLEALESSITICSMFIFAVMVMTTVTLVCMALAHYKKTFQELRAQNIFKKLFGLYLLLLCKVFYGPLIDIIVRSFRINNKYELAMLLPLNLMNMISLLLIILIQFYF